MTEALKRFLIIFPATLAAYLVVYFGWSVLNMPALALLPSQMVRWLAATTFLYLGSSLTEAGALAVLLFAGLLVSPYELREGGAVVRLLQSVLVVAIVAAGLQAAFALAVAPWLESVRAAALDRTQVVNQLRDRSEQALIDRDFAAARRYAESVARVDSTLRSEVAAKLGEITRAAAAERERSLEDPATETGGVPEQRPRRQTAQHLLQNAERSMESGDFVTAHLSARRAFDLDPRLTGARELAERAWAQVEIPESAAEQTELMERKRNGLSALRAGRPVEAYYIFRALERDYPDDPDVQRYRREAEAAADELAFFLDDFEGLPAGNGVPNVVLLQPAAEYSVEIIRFGSISGMPTQLFAVDVEAIGLAEDGSVAYHLEADRAQLGAGRVLLRGLHSDSSEAIEEPRYLAGSRPGGLQAVLPLNVSSAGLVRLSRAQNAPERLTAVDIWRLIDDDQMGGFARRRVEMDLLRRLVSPIALVIFWFFCLGIGYRLRSSHSERPRVLGLAPLIFVPPVLALLSTAFEYTLTLGAGGLLIAIGLTGAAALLFAFEGVLLIGVLVFAARSLT